MQLISSLVCNSLLYLFIIIVLRDGLKRNFGKNDVEKHVFKSFCICSGAKHCLYPSYRLLITPVWLFFSKPFVLMVFLSKNETFFQKNGYDFKVFVKNLLANCAQNMELSPAEICIFRIHAWNRSRNVENRKSPLNSKTQLKYMKYIKN